MAAKKAMVVKAKKVSLEDLRHAGRQVLASWDVDHTLEREQRVHEARVEAVGRGAVEGVVVDALGLAAILTILPWTEVPEPVGWGLAAASVSLLVSLGLQAAGYASDDPFSIVEELEYHDDFAQVRSAPAAATRPGGVVRTGSCVRCPLQA